MTMIEAQNITKILNKRSILNDVSFEVEEGEIFGLLGPNGAGKTTTLTRALARPHRTIICGSEREREDLYILSYAIKDLIKQEIAADSKTV